MKTHAFRSAVENGATMEQFAALFAIDVSFHTPILAKTVRGKDHVLRMEAVVASLISNAAYTLEVSDSRRTVLLWKGMVHGYELQGAIVIIDDEAGLIRDLTVFMRPWPVVSLFREAMYGKLSSVLPSEYWETALSAVEAEGDRGETVPPPPQLKLAEGVEFHSPFLSKSVSGRASVEAIFRHQGTLQGPRRHAAVFSTPAQRVELADGSFRGQPLQLLAVSQLDVNGDVADMTVMVNPWPVVSAIRETSMASPLTFLTPDYWMVSMRAQKGGTN